MNGDGCLEAHEVGEALRSRDIKITDEQVQMFIDGTFIDKIKLLLSLLIVS